MGGLPTPEAARAVSEHRPAPIVKIVSAAELTKALYAGFAKYGRKPTRVVACPVQISKWAESIPFSRHPAIPPTGFSFMGVPLVAGAPDAQIELVWAEPLESAA